jgi:hypothetical protein
LECTVGFLFIYYECHVQDVALAALYVSTKMHDTLKKPRELLAVSYAVRFPEFAAKSKHPSGEVDLDTMDAQVFLCVSSCQSF